MRGKRKAAELEEDEPEILAMPARKRVHKKTQVLPRSSSVATATTAPMAVTATSSLVVSQTLDQPPSAPKPVAEQPLPRPASQTGPPRPIPSDSAPSVPFIPSAPPAPAPLPERTSRPIVVPLPAAAPTSSSSSSSSFSSSLPYSSARPEPLMRPPSLEPIARGQPALARAPSTGARLVHSANVVPSVPLPDPIPLQDRKEVRFGRKASTNDYVLDSKLPAAKQSLSRNHAMITYDEEEETYSLIDTSKNGVYVNDCRVKRHELKDGDIIIFGKIPPVVEVGQYCSQPQSEFVYTFFDNKKIEEEEDEESLWEKISGFKETVTTVVELGGVAVFGLGAVFQVFGSHLAPLNDKNRFPRKNICEELVYTFDPDCSDEAVYTVYVLFLLLIGLIIYLTVTSVTNRPSSSKKK